MLAEKALPAESFNIHRYSVTWLDGINSRSNLFYNADHFVTNCDAGDCARHTTMLDMQITGTDAGQSYLHDSIFFVYQNRLGLFSKFEFPVINVSITKHDLLLTL